MKNDPIMRPFKLGGQLVPGIWQYMMPPSVLEMRLPKEELATCNNCPMVASGGFRPDYKCCTYHPRIPNFMLGLALDDPIAKGPVENFIRADFTNPEGTEHTPLQWIDSLSIRSDDDYGKGEKVLCSFLDQSSGGCTVYAFRNSVCSTFFCWYEDGEEGEAFWENLQYLAGQLETALAQWALEQIGFNIRAYFRRFDSLANRMVNVTDPDTKAWSKETLQILWGDWYGREAQLFKRCAEAVKDNRERLYEVAYHQGILKPTDFEIAASNFVPKKFHNQLSETDFLGGEPTPIADIEYSSTLAYRNLCVKRSEKMLKESKAEAQNSAMISKKQRSCGGCG
jgi:Fe-S-cluster containining protein